MSEGQLYRFIGGPLDGQWRTLPRYRVAQTGLTYEHAMPGKKSVNYTCRLLRGPSVFGNRLGGAKHFFYFAPVELNDEEALALLFVGIGQ